VSRRLDLLAFAVVIAVAAVLVAAQPVTDPWWVYADADATYSASALNIISGGHSHFFDHPGLPEQELLALTFGAVSLSHGGPTHSWAASEMTHLDRARPVFRGWAILFFVGGAGLAYLLLRRLLGHWTWGLAGGLLWGAIPDLSDAIQIRPDVLLSALVLVVGFFIVRGWERRSATMYALAALVAGFALMTKLHAVAVLPALVLATVLARPSPGWWPKLRADVARRRIGIAIAAAIWLAFFVLLNWNRFTISVRNAHPKLLAALVLVVAAYAIVTALRPNRFFDPLYLALGGAFVVGMAIPLLLVLSDSPRALIETFDTLIGRNINAGITPFGHSATEYFKFPLLEAEIVVALAGIAAFVGARRRTAWPGLWFASSAVAFLLAALRLGNLRYYDPAFVLAIPAALWLFRRTGSAAAPWPVWIVVAAVVVPTFVHMRDPAHAAQRDERVARASTRLEDRLLKPNEVALVSAYTYPGPDARWFELIQLYVPKTPPYPYRFIPADARAIASAAAEGKHVAYFVGPEALAITKPQKLTLMSGTYYAVPVPHAREGIVGAVRLRSGPGT
jgi:hypothetical protein